MDKHKIYFLIFVAFFLIMSAVYVLKSRYDVATFFLVLAATKIASMETELAVKQLTAEIKKAKTEKEK